jgi:hypothetical protein
MLRTNLSTRPFYNERLVHWLLALAAVVVAAFTVYNLTHFLSLSGRQRTLADAAARDEAAARDLTARAAAIRRGIDPKVLQRVTAQAAEANALIDARAFSWTALFNDIESTLPPTVMLTSVSPRITEDGVVVRFVVLGRSVEAIDGFIEKLEATGRFHGVLAADEEVNDDGLYQTLIQGAYRQPETPPPPQSGAPAAAGAAAPGTQLAGPPATGGTP